MRSFSQNLSTLNLRNPGPHFTTNALAIDALAESCTHQATNLTSLASLSIAGFSGRLAQFAMARLGLGHRALFSQFAPKIFGLGVESGTFEACHRLLRGESFQDGFLCAWKRNFFHFGIFQFSSHLFHGQNFFLQQSLQSSSMLLADWGIYGIGLAERPTGSLVEQWVHNLGTGLALTFGSHLSLIFSGEKLRNLESRFSRASQQHNSQAVSRILQMASHKPTLKERFLNELAARENFGTLSREQAFLRLLHIRRELETLPLKRGERRIHISFTEILVHFKTVASHENFGGTSLASESIHRAAKYLDHVYCSWDRQGAHYIRLAKMGPHHTHTLAQYEYAKEHLKLPEGEGVFDSSYGSLLRWAVFLAEHRDALELAEPFLIHNLSTATRLQCIEGPGFVDFAKLLIPDLLAIEASHDFTFKKMLELVEQAPKHQRDMLLDAAARDQMRLMEKDSEALEESSRDFIRLTRWAFWRHHRGLKYSTTSDRLRATILEAVVPLHNNHGVGSLVEYYEAWSHYVDPAHERRNELADLYEVTHHNLKKWHLRCANRSPEAQILIRALRASVLRIYRGDLPLSFADEKHPLHRTIDQGEIPLVNTGQSSLVQIYEKYALLLAANRYSKARIERLIMDALRAEHIEQELYLASPEGTPEDVEALRIHFHEAILQRYRGCIPKKGEGSLSDKSPLRHFHESGIFPVKNKPGMPLIRIMELMREYALGSEASAKDASRFQLLQRDAIDAAQGWKSVRENIRGENAHYLHEIICEAWANIYAGPPPSIGEASLPLAHPLRRFTSEGRLGRGATPAQRNQIVNIFREAVLDLNPQVTGNESLATLLENAIHELD